MTGRDRQLVIVTGAATGIGRALVLGLAAAGYDVAFSWWRTADAAASLGAMVPGARGYESDVGDARQVADFHARVAADFGRAPDALINNAGIQTWARLVDLAVDDWDRVIRTNLRGTFLNTQAAARAMMAAGKGGAIVNLGSGCNKLAFPRLVDYTAAKGGIEQFTKVSALELGPSGIRVNCVAPGAIATERTAQEAAGYSDKWAALTPLRRIGTPEDIVGPVLFLLSDAASFITGQTIWVDGGVFSSAPWPDYGD